MGIWGTIKGFFGFGKSSGSRSTSSYTYEPDKVEIAKIERDMKLKLADKELERVELMRDAQLEFIQAQAMSRATAIWATCSVACSTACWVW